MKRLPLPLALLGGLVAIQVTAVFAGTKPSVTVTRVTPVVVRGAGFHSAESVKVVVRLPAVYRKTVIATRRGRFVAYFHVAAGKCITIRVSAIGNKGSRASTKVPATCKV